MNNILTLSWFRNRRRNAVIGGLAGGGTTARLKANHPASERSADRSYQMKNVDDIQAKVKPDVTTGRGGD